MAYMNAEKKAKIAAALKAVVPAGWKYTLAVRDHSTIAMTIQSAPVDLLAHIAAARRESYPCGEHEAVGAHWRVNHHWIDKQFSGDLLPVMRAIVDALNTDNHDRSDIMSDYHDVGHYIDLNVGRWDKPFAVK